MRLGRTVLLSAIRNKIVQNSGLIILTVLISFWALPWRALGQGSPGYSKVGSVAGTVLNFTTPALTDGATYQFQVTSQNGSGESVPMTTNMVTLPPTGTHTVTVSWSASVVDATHDAPTTYNVYQHLNALPNPPTGAQAVVN